jgi:hypothetical protein
MDTAYQTGSWDVVQTEKEILDFIDRGNTSIDLIPLFFERLPDWYLALRRKVSYYFYDSHLPAIQLIFALVCCFQYGYKKQFLSALAPLVVLITCTLQGTPFKQSTVIMVIITLLTFFLQKRFKCKGLSEQDFKCINLSVIFIANIMLMFIVFFGLRRYAAPFQFFSCLLFCFYIKWLALVWFQSVKTIFQQRSCPQDTSPEHQIWTLSFPSQTISFGLFF